MRAMEDSGIEWIGQIPQEWQVSKMKHIGEYINGYAFKPSQWGQEGKQIIRIQDLTQTSDQPNYYDGELDEKYLIKTGDLLISWAATLDAFVWEKEEAWLNQHIFKAIPKESAVIKSYFYWLIKEAMLNMNNGNKHGIMMQHVTYDVFDNFSIPLPGLCVQERIAKFLEKKCAEIDALIAAKEKTNALLKERRQSIIYEAVTKGLNPDAPMKDSGIEWIGQIPENWDVVALKRVATPSTGMTPSKANSQYWEGDIPWFSSKDIKSDFLFDSEDHISQQAVEDCGLTIHGENSVVFCARSGILRHTFPVAVLKCKGTINQDLRVLATSATIDPEFLMYYLRGMNNTIVTLYQKVGATVESIEMEWLLYLPVVLPPLEEQKDIARFVVAHCSEIDELIVTNEVSIQKLKEYRQSIIYEAVTGKIEV